MLLRVYVFKERGCVMTLLSAYKIPGKTHQQPDTCALLKLVWGIGWKGYPLDIITSICKL